MTNKIKSSALLIAIALGVVVSGLVIGASVAMGQFAKMSAQARDGKIAYRAALSGIDDGLLRYKYAKAENSVGNLFGTSGNIFLPRYDLKQTPSSYKISFKMDSISVGKTGRKSPVEQTIPNLNDPTLDPDSLKNTKNARMAKMDETIDIDLTNIIPKMTTPKSITISYSGPFEKDASGNPLPAGMPDYFTALNVKLTNVVAGAEEQSVFEKTNSDSSVSNIKINAVDLAKCGPRGGARCHLRIKPQIASKNMLINGTKARRLSGTLDDTVARTIFYAISAPGLAPTEDAPGTITLTSVGTAGGAVRKIDAKIDVGPGTLIGIFDYGIYCGKACEGI